MMKMCPKWKVKIITSERFDELETKVNEFIKNSFWIYQVQDIKYCADSTVKSAMIICKVYDNG